MKRCEQCEAPLEKLDNGDYRCPDCDITYDPVFVEQVL